MAANILVTDDKRNALEKITKRTCDIAVCVSTPGAALLYALRQDVLYVLSEKSGFSVSERVGGVSTFSADMDERQIIDRLGNIFGSVTTKYELFDDSDDDEGFFEIGML